MKHIHGTLRANGTATYRSERVIGRGPKKTVQEFTRPARITEKRVKTNLWTFDRATGREVSAHYIGKGTVTLLSVQLGEVRAP